MRQDYCRMRRGFRQALLQAGGAMHGGAITSLLDSVLVTAMGATRPEDVSMATVDLHVTVLEAIVDVVAEGWVVRRGRRLVAAGVSRPPSCAHHVGVMAAPR